MAAVSISGNLAIRSRREAAQQGRNSNSSVFFPGIIGQGRSKGEAAHQIRNSNSSVFIPAIVGQGRSRRENALRSGNSSSSIFFPGTIGEGRSRRRSLRARAELGAAPAATDVKEWVTVLKNAAKTRRVPPAEVLAALAAIKKAKLDSSSFFETLGGVETPGRTWMLIFTAQGRLEKGSYFPVTAVQRFDAAGKRIENGVFLGPLGSLTFEGRLSWRTKKLAFIFESVGIKVGPLGPLRISLGGDKDKEPDMKDPFFIWFYVDEEIAVAQGRGGGTAFWCR
ncbi:microbial collagenase isoform X2 [Wolffia australiana]